MVVSGSATDPADFKPKAMERVGWELEGIERLSECQKFNQGSMCGQTARAWQAVEMRTENWNRVLKLWFSMGTGETSPGKGNTRHHCLGKIQGVVESVLQKHLQSSEEHTRKRPPRHKGNTGRQAPHSLTASAQSPTGAPKAPETRL